jgi:hypothetical protein
MDAEPWREPRPDGGGSPNEGASPKDLAAGAVQTLKQETASFAEHAKDRATDALQQQKGAASETLGDFANAIRKAGDELAQSDQSMVGRVVRQAADGLENLARSVSDKRPEELIDTVRDFGRRNPTAFIAGSVLVGVALGRFLKSSGQGGDGVGSETRQFTAPGGAPPMVDESDLQVPAAAPGYDLGSTMPEDASSGSARSADPRGV